MRQARFVVFALVASGLPLGCGSELPDEEPVVRPVRYEQVVATGSGRTRSFSGAAQSGLESRLSFKVSGTIEHIAVKVGDTVQKGDPIARLDPTDLSLRLQDAQASLARQNAERRQTAANYERVMKLYERRNASKAELDAARAASEASGAGVTSAEQNVELARRNLDYASLNAPIEGAISDVPVEINENVSPGAVVAVLTSRDQPEVACSVPEALIASIREGQPVEVAFDAIPGARLQATVTEVGVVASRSGGAYPVIVRLDRPSTDVRPGMAAEIFFRFEATGGQEHIYVPAFSVLEDQAGRYAFVVEPFEEGQGTVHRRPVTVGELTSAGLEIRTGLTDGELLVTAGVTKLRDGQTVRLPKAPGK